MKTVILPEELNVESSSSVGLYYYQSHDNLSKQQVILNRNTFSFLTEGYKEVYFGNAHHAIQNDQFLLMKSGHCLMTEKLSDQSHNYTSILLFFSDEVIENVIRKHDLYIAEEYESVSVGAIKYDPYIFTFRDNLLNLLKLPFRTRQKILEVKFEEIILYLFEKGYGNTILPLLSPQNRDLQDFVKVIESNQMNKLTIKELAFLCHMSVSTFKRQFEKVYHTSPIKWFQNRRLEYAHHLLQNESKRASDIFYEVGYESLSSFVHAYKLKYGITPKQGQIS